MKQFMKHFGAGMMYLGIFLEAQTLVVSVGVLVFAIVSFVKELLTAVQYGVAPGFKAFIIRMMDMFGDSLLLLTFLSGILALAVIVIIFACRKKKLHKEISLHKMSPLGGFACVSLGMAMNFAVLGIFNLIPFPESWLESQMESSALVGTDQPILLILTTVIMAPIVEEIVFRGLMFSRFGRVMPRWLAGLITSAIFGFVHGSIIAFFYTFALAMIMNLVMIRYRSLLASILVHFGFNVIGTLTAFLPEELPEAMNNMFGIAVIVGVVIGALLIVLILTTTEDHRDFPSVRLPRQTKRKPAAQVTYIMTPNGYVAVPNGQPVPPNGYAPVSYPEQNGYQAPQSAAPAAQNGYQAPASGYQVPQNGYAPSVQHTVPTAEACSAPSAQPSPAQPSEQAANENREGTGV